MRPCLCARHTLGSRGHVTSRPGVPRAVAGLVQAPLPGTTVVFCAFGGAWTRGGGGSTPPDALSYPRAASAPCPSVTHGARAALPSGRGAADHRGHSGGPEHVVPVHSSGPHSLVAGLDLRRVPRPLGHSGTSALRPPAPALRARIGPAPQPRGCPGDWWRVPCWEASDGTTARDTPTGKRPSAGGGSTLGRPWARPDITPPPPVVALWASG